MGDRKKRKKESEKNTRNKTKGKDQQNGEMGINAKDGQIARKEWTRKP